MFNFNDFDIIDISHTVIPGEDVDRPFAIQKALLQDKTFRYNILKTHSHVGCHVEVGAHFYENGKTITDYPLERFRTVQDMLVMAHYWHIGYPSATQLDDGTIIVGYHEYSDEDQPLQYLMITRFKL